MVYDFTGMATVNDIRCTDGRTIKKDAFKHNDGDQVPLVWNHRHDSPDNILGYALLKNELTGVRAFCKFNDTQNGKEAKELVRHGDIKSLSIYANQLKQHNGDVLHGCIREVSLVLAGANKGAVIDSVLEHSDGFYDSGDDAIIFSGETINVTDDEMAHADDKKDEPSNTPEKDKEEGEKKGEKMADKKFTLEDAKEEYDNMTDRQQQAVEALVGVALSVNDNEEDDEEDNNEMNHNVFENDNHSNSLSHAEFVEFANETIGGMKRYGNLSDSFVAHAAEYGIEDIDFLKPDAKTLETTPEFIKRDTGWVADVINGVHRTPFSRIKSIFADITEDEARAKGYIKGKLKKEEVFSLLKRTTTPTTVYKKQKFDRDDLADITSFDVIAWIKSEMRMMLNEEIARAILVGDGRLASDDDKIDATSIRPIAFDDALYTVQKQINANNAETFIDAVIRSRKDYKGSGNPKLYTTEDMLTECLLLKDTLGHYMYKSAAELASVMRVSEIVTVPVMENVTGAAGGTLLGLIVNLADYNLGADKGGETNFFDDFDIDYNQQKYLMETRRSGALTKPYSAVAVEYVAAG